METKEMLIDDIMSGGVYAVSLVENPAIEDDFIYLSTEHLKLAITEQGMVYGMALIPDKKIPRRSASGETYEIYFKEETVRQAAHLFLSRNQNNNVTLGHEVETNGVSFVESWVVVDEKLDKLAALGLNPVKGAWALGGYVKDESIREDIKAGRFKGFSIEGKFKNKESFESKLNALLDKFDNK